MTMMNLIIPAAEAEFRAAHKAIEVLAFHKEQGIHSGLSDKFLETPLEKSLKGKPYTVIIITKVREVFFKESSGPYKFKIDENAYGPFREKDYHSISPSNLLTHYLK
jgi:hypothetical protein